MYWTIRLKNNTKDEIIRMKMTSSSKIIDFSNSFFIFLYWQIIFLGIVVGHPSTQTLRIENFPSHLAIFFNVEQFRITDFSWHIYLKNPAIHAPGKLPMFWFARCAVGTGNFCFIHNRLIRAVITIPVLIVRFHPTFRLGNR